MTAESRQSHEKGVQAGNDTRKTSRSSWPLMVGFSTFGLLVGVATGLSSYEGISQTLLSSLFTFAGGTLLGFSGTLARKGESSDESARRIGFGLTCFSLSVLLGLYAGITVRVGSATGKPGTDDQHHAVEADPSVSFSLQSEHENLCSSIRHNLRVDLYQGEQGKDLAVVDLRTLAEAACRE